MWTAKFMILHAPYDGDIMRVIHLKCTLKITFFAFPLEGKKKDKQQLLESKKTVRKNTGTAITAP